MDFFHIIIIGATAGTLSMILIYIYLYFMYRERYIAIWAVAWFTLLLRNIFFDSGIFNWKYSILPFILYQLLFIGCSLIFVWGTSIFVGQTFKKWWVYGAASASLLSILLFLLESPILYKLIPPTWFAGIVLAWIAVAFIRNVDLTGIGKVLIGIAFALWSIITIIMPFFFETFPYLIALTGGILRLLIAISTVIVFLERSRRNLIAQEARYRFLVDNAIDVIYYYRLLPTSKLEYISPAVFSITGYTPEEYYADEKLGFNLIYPNDCHISKKFIHNPSQSNKFSITLRLVRKDNIIVWIEQKCMLIYDKMDNLVALEGIIRDVTDRKLEQAAALNLVGNMAVTIAHEIRNPLTTIRGYLQLLEKKNKVTKVRLA